MRYLYTIGLVYWRSMNTPFSSMRVHAHDDKTALALACSFLKPHHLQTLTIISKEKKEMRQLFCSKVLEEIRDSALHYYALAVTDGWYGIYWNWKYMKQCFSSSRLGLFSRAKAVVVYDQLINNDKRMEDNLLFKT